MIALKLIPMGYAARTRHIPAVLVMPGAAFFANDISAAVVLVYLFQAIRAHMLFIAHQFDIVVRCLASEFWQADLFGGRYFGRFRFDLCFACG